LLAAEQIAHSPSLSSDRIRLNWIVQDRPICNDIHSHAVTAIFQTKSFCTAYSIINGEAVCTIVTEKTTTHAILGEAANSCRFAKIR